MGGELEGNSILDEVGTAVDTSSTIMFMGSMYSRDFSS